MMSTSRGSAEKQAALKTISSASDVKRETPTTYTTTTTTNFHRRSPDVSTTAGSVSVAAAAAAAAAALSHQRMLMSPLPFDRVSIRFRFCSGSEYLKRRIFISRKPKAESQYDHRGGFPEGHTPVVLDTLNNAETENDTSK